MIQQVNLLRHSSHGDNQLLKNPYFLTSIVVCVVLLTISVINYSNHSAQISRHQQLQQELQAASARLQEIQARFPSQTPDTTLQLALQQTQQRYQSLQQIVALLTEDQSDQVLGFSRYLTALADQADANVWLTRIQFDSESHHISLQGSTFKSEQIPALLQRLQHSKAFQGRHFARLLIQKNPNNDTQTDFSVSSNLKPEADSHDAK
ncbi:MAG: hypothetical protein CTY19_10075 [Methylomonas sp.]|nr:MAG: hypothetical protein CTY19_10075 [Methylomonas sp.]